MCPCFRKTLFAAAIVSLSITGCSSSVKTESLGHVDISPNAAPPPAETQQQQSSSTAPGGLPVANKYGERYDGDAEDDIAQESLKAWRTATEHDKTTSLDVKALKEARTSDEKSAMDQLEKLAKSHPTSSTVQFMMGQVEEHFGKKIEAIEHFKLAAQKNLVSGMTLFKLAETERKAGKTEDAIKDYKKLLEVEPQFIPGEVGLAKMLLAKDAKSAEAQKLLESVLSHDPENEEAKALKSQADKARSTQ